MKKTKLIFNVKSSIKFFYILIAAFLPSTVLHAQTRKIDLQAVIASPQNGDTLMENQPFPYILYVKNNGPDAVLTSDTVFFEYQFSSGEGYLTHASIPSGSSLELLDANATFTIYGPDSMCFVVAMFEPNVTDPDPSNNQVCYTLFIKQATGVAAVQSGSALFNIYPNPATSSVTLTYTSSGEADVDVWVNNIVGKEVLFHNYGKLQQGINDLKLDLSGLQEGMYFVEIQQGNSQSTGKLIVQ